MPPARSRTTGRLAALGWVGVAAAALFQSAETTIPWETTYMVVTILSVAAAVLSVIALVKIQATASPGRTARIAVIALGGLAIVALALVNWATVVWSALLSVAAVVAAQSATVTGAGIRASTWMFAAGWPVSFALFVVLDWLGLGPMDEYGDHPWAAGIGIAAWAVMYAAGLSRLTNEADATTIPPTEPATALAD